MAIAFDSSAQIVTTGMSNLTYALTVSGANRILFVNVTFNVTNSVTSVTYNGIAMTSVNGPLAAGGSFATELFYLIAPSTGTNNVVAILNNTIGSQVSQAASYTGVSQTGFPDAISTGGPTFTASFSQNITTVADNCWMVWAIVAGGAPSAGANTVFRQSEGTAFGAGLADTNSAQTPAGSKTMAGTGGGLWIGIMASFAPPPNTKIFSVAGIPQASISSAEGVPLASISTVSGVPNS